MTFQEKSHILDITIDISIIPRLHADTNMLETGTPGSGAAKTPIFRINRQGRDDMTVSVTLRRTELELFWQRMARHPWDVLTFMTECGGRTQYHTYRSPIDDYKIRLYAGLAVRIGWQNWLENVSAIYKDETLTIEGPKDMVEFIREAIPR